jgi:FdhD protein
MAHSMRKTTRRTIHRINGTTCTSRKDRIVVEEPLAIRIIREQADDFQLSITMRTPGDDFALVAGFLFTEGLIQHADDIVHISHCINAPNEPNPHNIVRVQLRQLPDWGLLQRHFLTTSSCGVCGKTSIEAVQPPFSLTDEKPPFVVSSELIHALPGQLTSAQDVFSQTGGLHAAGLFDEAGTLLSTREDIGRHNALDKLIGQQLLARQLPLSRCSLCVSSRASFELVQKAIYAGIPILAAVGAPSSLAIELAETHQLTLLGFVRDQRFNLYSAPHRISEAT